MQEPLDASILVSQALSFPSRLAPEARPHCWGE